MVKRILLAVALLAVVFWLASCQTVSGLGKDITWIAESTAGVLEGR